MSNNDKARFAQALLASEGQFNITARTGDSVSIPEYLQKDRYVTLTLGTDLPLPIHDLVIDDIGISGTLHFGSVGYFWCLVRWEAVRVINAPSGVGRVWLDLNEREVEAKPDVHAQSARQASKPIPFRLESARIPHLRLIKGGKS